jgi:hypothetical protein
LRRLPFNRSGLASPENKSDAAELQR